MPNENGLGRREPKLFQGRAVNAGIRLACSQLIRRDDRIPDVAKAAALKPSQLPIDRVGCVSHDAEQVTGLLQADQGRTDALEELDDVQQVYSNLNFSEEAVAQYEAQAA